MIFKRAFFLAIVLFVVASTNAVAAIVDLDNFKLGSLSIAPDSALNLQSTHSYGIVTVTSFPQIEAYLKNGFDGGTWNGLGGIRSSVAAADPFNAGALALTDGQNYLDLSGNTKFAGHNVAPTDSLIRYTYYGDANMDGVVDDADYAYFEYGYSAGMSGWMWGDFTYDGVVDNTDLELMNYVRSLNLPSLGPAGPYVPEPSTLVMLFSLALGGLLWRRRRA